MKSNKKLKRFFYVDKSKIHGKGLFSHVEIETGEYLGRYHGPKVSENGMHVLWVESDNGKWEGYDGKNILRYLNHCKQPNAEFEGRDLYAISDIEPGEEITFDYGEEP
jgi:SET domain-containing protein